MHIKDCFSKQCILGTIGVILVAFGTLLAVFWTTLFETMLAKEMKLGPNSRSYDIWKTPPIPMSLDIYFFNWTNPRNFTRDDFEKPILDEVGPYRFTENMDKIDINWHPENSTISFMKKSLYHFDPDGSNGSLDDNITTLNIIALSAAAKALNWDYIKRKSVSIGLSLYNQKGHVTKSARELIFEGYQDDLIDMARDMPAIFGDEQVTIPFDRFGWFYMRNDTGNLTGHYNMHTGDADISQIGVIKNWNYNTRTDFYPEECGLVNGSAGEFYPPNQKKDKPISFFTPDMCRSISFDFDKEVVINGITGYKFAGGEKTVDNGTLFPENKCFSTGQVVPSGVMNVSSCRFGTPVFMSFPHYYAADPYYIDQVSGLNPSRAKHEFYLTLEPMTGIALDVAARFQINMLIRPVPNVALYNEAPFMFFPVLWFEQKVTITEEMSSQVQIVLMIPSIGHICSAVIIVIGLILIFCLPVCRLFRHKGEAIIADDQQEHSEKVIPEGSPLIAKNGNMKHIQFIKSNKDVDSFKMAPLAEKETEAFYDRN